ncbi:MAG TPA: serine/threonine protein kinase [Planctomycetes bacterium]|nr:serine/threonine protein kinase [Fuerstiella sp.]HIK94059.1 serine/threonine protein kinase [Planctomycetota bacterium]
MNALPGISICVAVTLCATTAAEDWSAFRGPSGDGISGAVNVPTEWSEDQGVAWKVPLPGKSNGSPIVSANRVFLVSAQDAGQKRHLHCFDANDGTSKWVRTVEFAKEIPTHKTNLYGGTTPAADGERVVVWHGSAGLFCYDFAGHELWKRQLGEFRHQWGYGTSPVLHKGKVILHSGPGQTVFVAAFNLKNGDTIWQTVEPVENDGERNDANKYMGSWSTPVVATVDGQEIVVCSMATRVNGYDLTTGKIIWSCNGLRGERGDLAYASPVIADDICVAMGGFKGPAIGFRMTGSGDISDRRLWRKDKAIPQRIGSGVFVDGYIYMANAGINTIECINPTTGESTWQQRIQGGAHWGSLVYADGRLYTTDQDGSTTVFRPNPEKFEAIATNRLNDAGNSTPAIIDGVIYVRTFGHLYCIR